MYIIIKHEPWVIAAKNFKTFNLSGFVESPEHIRQKKKMPVFPITYQKKLGSVGRDFFFFRRAVGIHSNLRMIITHAVMLLYIGLQEGLHNI